MSTTALTRRIAAQLGRSTTIPRICEERYLKLCFLQDRAPILSGMFQSSRDRRLPILLGPSSFLSVSGLKRPLISLPAVLWGTPFIKTVGQF
ncbi:hypothetical protein K474DRAFT_1661996 [Panus rudis PR-1116 ss-1]|nr:hypothetical protein K474DRAFT_1661996 [Panus rudis PR-1116 ss-1]